MAMPDPFAGFAPTVNPAIAPTAPVQRAMAQPGPSYAPPLNHPRALPGPAAANTPWDAIIQALSQAGPRFLAKAEEQARARMPQLDAQIAQMQANNAAVAERLRGMKLGAEGLDAAPRIAQGPVAPLDLFGGPTPEPVKKRPAGAPPSSQEFMQEHNARTPKKNQQAQYTPTPIPAVNPAQASAGVTPQPIVPQAPPRTINVQAPAQQPTDWRERTAAIAAALGQSLAAGQGPEPTNWLQRKPRVYQRRG